MSRSPRGYRHTRLGRFAVDPSPRRALSTHRALSASRCARGADERAELHECLVVHPGRTTRAGQQPTRDLPDLSLSSRGLEVRLGSESTPQDARDVRVDELGASLVGERRNGARGILTDSRQLAQTFGLGGQTAVRQSTLLCHCSREAVQITGACIIAESLPRLAHLTRSRQGEMCQTRKPLHESIVEAKHARDLCLLEHQLGYEDAIRVACPPPGKVASILPVPCTQSAAEGRVTGGSSRQRSASVAPSPSSAPGRYMMTRARSRVMRPPPIISSSSGKMA